MFRDRNFTITSVAAGTLTFGLLGVFLPLTLYLQSVLGMSALAAGLTIAPMSLMAMVLAPFTGRLADRIGGKYILIASFVLFATGIGLVVASTEPDPDRWDFLAGLIIAGFGMGGIFAPLQTVAMRNIPPRLAGAAAGVQNTIRQLGGVVGGAAVGAVLQNRLADAMHEQAQARADQLPPGTRARFVAGFDDAGAGGLEVGGHDSGKLPIPKGLPEPLAEQLGRLAHAVYTHGFVDAMHVTLALPIAVIAVSAVLCLGLRRRRRAAAADTAEERPAAR